VEDDLEREAKRLIREALRTEWKPKMRALVQTIVAKRAISWAEACDSAELDIVAASEQLKMEAARQLRRTDDMVGWELSAQAMLDIIAEVRTEDS